MMRYLIDENLPQRFSIWHGEDYLHVVELGRAMTDMDIWSFAKAQELTIVTKDADFSDRLLLEGPPPKVIRLRLGNMRLSKLREFVGNQWPMIMEHSKQFSLVQVFSDRFECIE